jgi:hypothetical protein
MSLRPTQGMMTEWRGLRLDTFGYGGIHSDNGSHPQHSISLMHPL